MKAAKMGRDSALPLRKDWESVKDDIMRKAVTEKFAQNPAIAAILLQTDEQQIVERTTTDYFWGCGTDGSGKNMLGLILMDTREALRKETRCCDR